MATKTGRKPRAPGTSMVRLSVLLQEPLRDALELIARDRRTSLSQAMEYLIETAGRDYKIEGRSLLELVRDSGDQSTEEFVFNRISQAAANPAGETSEVVRNRAKVLRRLLTMPASLLKKNEQYFCDLHSALAGVLPDNDDQLVALQETASDCYQQSIPVDSLVQFYSAALKKLAEEPSTDKSKR